MALLLLVSAASVWEIVIKAALGRIDVELDDIEDAVVNGGFDPLPITVHMPSESAGYQTFIETL